MTQFGKEPMLAKGPEQKKGLSFREAQDKHLQMIEDKANKGPLFSLEKLDGIRCTLINGVPMTRKLKPIPNRFISAHLTEIAGLLDGIDGEIVTYDENGKAKQFNPVQSDVMTEEGEPNFVFHVFDRWNAQGTYAERMQELPPAGAFDRIVPVHAELCTNMAQILAYEEAMLNAGFEGLIIRDPAQSYKFGRSTMKEFGMVKLKRWADSEAMIVAIYPEMENTNEATKDERGFTKRSKAKDGLVAKASMGTMDCIDVYHGWQFKVGGGPGMTKKLRAEIWEHQEDYLMRVFTYKYFEYGMKDVPRFPGFVGWRDPKKV